jgi:sulfonate transport system ATP-binding protein
MRAVLETQTVSNGPHTGSAQPAGQTPRGVGLEARRLVKRYGDREVLRQLQLRIEPGEFVAIVGRSGCGKSTLLRLVAGLEEHHGGELRLDGRPLKGLNEHTRIMFQDARLLPWKRVLDNVALGLSKAERFDAGSAQGVRDRAAQVLAQVGLGERLNDWPARLSGGQRQRVALARALVHNPRLLLLDEPLGALDALTRIEMHALIERLWQTQGFTALLVTHDVQEAVALADRVILIEDGRIALDERVDLPRPRERGSAAFAALENRILTRVLRQSPNPAEQEPEPQWPAGTQHIPGGIPATGLRWAI